MMGGNDHEEEIDGEDRGLKGPMKMDNLYDDSVLDLNEPAPVPQEATPSSSASPVPPDPTPRAEIAETPEPTAAPTRKSARSRQASSRLPGEEPEDDRAKTRELVLKEAVTRWKKMKRDCEIPQ
jgi:hypothetical protein